LVTHWCSLYQDTVVGLRVTTSGKLRIANVNSGKYPTVTFAADPAQEVDREHHSWANYFLCGFKGVFDHLRNGGGAPVPQCAGLDVIVDGRVPTGSGLSSSSALVCASSLAVMTALGECTRSLACHHHSTGHAR
jgi:N-acetylgalactosamine kinase